MRWAGILALTLYLTLELVGMGQVSMPFLIAAVLLIARAAYRDGINSKRESE